MAEQFVEIIQEGTESEAEGTDGEDPRANLILQCRVCRKRKPALTGFYKNEATECKSCRSSMSIIRWNAKLQDRHWRLAAWKAAFPEHHRELVDAFFQGNPLKRVKGGKVRGPFDFDAFFAGFPGFPGYAAPAAAASPATPAASTRTLRRRHTV